MARRMAPCRQLAIRGGESKKLFVISGEVTSSPRCGGHYEDQRRRLRTCSPRSDSCTHGLNRLRSVAGCFVLE
jgi:hypothetical protein